MAFNLFKQVPTRRLRRNKFNLSFENKLTTNFGVLTPVYCKRVVPGDTFKIKSEALIRMAPLSAPLMHRANAYVHFFLVYNRNLWDGWKDWISTGDVDSQNLYPRFQMTKAVAASYCGKSSLADYLGFPAWTVDVDNASEELPIYDALPFRAFNQIYNEYYRDENYQTVIPIYEDESGIQQVTANSKYIDLLTLKNRNWDKDYFTSALPSPQRGEPTTIGLTNNLQIVGNGGYVTATGDPIEFATGSGDSQGHKLQSVNGDIQSSGTPSGDIVLGNNVVVVQGRAGSQVDVDFDVDDVAEKLRITGQDNVTTINELRRAFSIQRLKEAFARFGNRYTEYLRGIYGVTPADKSIGRPEFIGGMKLPLTFGEVLQTSESTSDSPLANMAGRGIAAGASKTAKCFCEDHGFIIGVLSIVPKADYMQGMPRQFLLNQPLDFYNPFLANIGEQPIYKQELVWWSDANNDNDTFGYTPRYAEYKFANGEIHGDFRASLSDWHMGRIFSYDRAPTLNSAFLQVKHQDTDRVFAVQEASYVDNLWVQCYFNVVAKRPMPKFGVPTI